MLKKYRQEAITRLYGVSENGDTHEQIKHYAFLHATGVMVLRAKRLLNILRTAYCKGSFPRLEGDGNEERRVWNAAIDELVKRRCLVGVHSLNAPDVLYGCTGYGKEVWQYIEQLGVASLLDSDIALDYSAVTYDKAQSIAGDVSRHQSNAGDDAGLCMIPEVSTRQAVAYALGYTVNYKSSFEEMESFEALLPLALFLMTSRGVVLRDCLRSLNNNGPVKKIEAAPDGAHELTQKKLASLIELGVLTEYYHLDGNPYCGCNLNGVRVLRLINGFEAIGGYNVILANARTLVLSEKSPRQESLSAIKDKASIDSLMSIDQTLSSINAVVEAQQDHVRVPVDEAMFDDFTVVERIRDRTNAQIRALLVSIVDNNGTLIDTDERSCTAPHLDWLLNEKCLSVKAHEDEQGMVVYTVTDGGRMVVDALRGTLSMTTLELITHPGITWMVRKVLKNDEESRAIIHLINTIWAEKSYTPTSRLVTEWMQHKVLYQCLLEMQTHGLVLGIYLPLVDRHFLPLVDRHFMELTDAGITAYHVLKEYQETGAFPFPI